jgi:hypothetical protein
MNAPEALVWVSRALPNPRTDYGAVRKNAPSGRNFEPWRYAMPPPDLDPALRTDIEAAAFRRLVQHLRDRSDVQNIDLMNLSGFCRNCLSRWYREAAAERGIDIADPDAREIVYGMAYKDWQAQHQTPASAEQVAAFKQTH